MLCNELFTRTLHLGTDMFQVRVEEVGIAGKAFIHKPKCPKGRREVLDDFRADGNLNGLDGGKQQGFEVPCQSNNNPKSRRNDNSP